MTIVQNTLMRHRRAASWAVASSILFGLFDLGAQPFAVALIPAPWDKLAHGGVFAVLAAAIGLASGLRGWRMVLISIAGAALLGALDEWHQVFLPGRQAGLGDLLADMAGASAGASFLWYCSRTLD